MSKYQVSNVGSDSPGHATPLLGLPDHTSFSLLTPARAATIVLLVILGVGISSIGGTFEDPQKGATTAPPKPAAPPATPSHASDTRDVGVGTADDDLFEDEYAARIDKLLSTVQHHPVPAEPKPKPKRRQSKPPPPDLDRI